MIVRITSKFGEVSRIHQTPHTGIDFGVPEGTPLKSIGDAVVKRVVDYNNENIGKGVIIRLSDGKEAIYGHLSDNSIVKVGQKLHEGDIIGLSGNTGHSTGPHLHFGLKEHGEFIDPTPLAQKLWERGSVANNDYPTIWGYLYEKILGDGLQHWAADYIMALPVMVGVSIGVWGLLNMVHSRLATAGVIGVFILGGLMLV